MQQIMIAIVGLTIYILFGYQVSPTCFENDDRIIIFKEPIPNKAMHGHMISRSEVPSEGSCRVNCYLDPNCVSINMGPFKEGNLMCELNKVTSSQKESFLGEKKAYTYLEIENPCSSNPCTKDCACQAGFTSRGFRCQCDLFDKHECGARSPCVNGGTCRKQAGKYSCDCPKNYSGLYCDILAEELGCFQDVPKNRVFKNLLVSFRGNIDWKNMWKVVQDCSEEARKEGMYYFAIQYYGECYGGPNGTKYDKYGPSKNCLSSPGVGEKSTNFVYRNTDL
ncbi:neurogenic locus notch homolog protein 2-like [Montipora foliosa]|uniref:neurogenic locus notch homolog protein 2-like n=1 Tax=Montipora foliosa TaxID=591990 RepID=UPI0035F14AB8